MTFVTPRNRFIVKLIAAVASIAMVVGIVVVLSREWPRVEPAVALLRSPDPVWLTVLVASVACNFVLTGFFLAILMRRHGHVGYGEMQMLIAASWLVNLLPIRPGLPGRMMWHRRMNAIPVAATLRVSIEAFVFSVVASAWVIIIAWVSGGRMEWMVAGIALPMCVAGGMAAAGFARPWTTAVTIRLGEIVVIALRTAAAFALIGHPISADAALGIACAGVSVGLIPVIGAGLGLREWTTGLIAPMVAGVSLELGVTAELVARAAELIIAVPAGTLAFLWLAKRWRGKKTTGASIADAEV